MEKAVGNNPTGEVQELCRFLQTCAEVQVTKWLCLSCSVQFVQTMRNEEVVPMGWMECGSMKHSTVFS